MVIKYTYELSSVRRQAGESANTMMGDDTDPLACSDTFIRAIKILEVEFIARHLICALP